MMLRKWTIYFLVCSGIAFCTKPAAAYVGTEPFADLAGSEFKLSFFVASSEIDYEVNDRKIDDNEDDPTNHEIERTIFGVNLSKGINEKWDIYGTLGYLFDGDYRMSASVEIDKGYYVSAGLKCKAFQSGKLSSHLYGQFDYVIEETYAGTQDGRSFEVEVDGFEITLGGVMKYQMDSNLSFYGGIAFVPLTDQSVDGEAILRDGRRTTMNGDLEREDKLGPKIGGKYNFDKTWAISGEGNLGYEQTYVLSVGAKF